MVVVPGSLSPAEAQWRVLLVVDCQGPVCDARLIKGPTCSVVRAGSKGTETEPSVRPADVWVPKICWHLLGH